VVVEVVDAVVVEHRLHAVDLDELIPGPEAVLDDEERFLPAFPELVDDQAQSDGIDLPSPLARREHRVGDAADDVALAAHELVGVGGVRDRHVVAERHEIDRVAQVCAVFVGDVELDALLAERAQEVPGVGPSGVHVAEGEVGVVQLPHRERVGGGGGERIDRHRDDHAPHLSAGGDLAGDPRGPGGCHQLMVHRLVQVSLGQVVARGDARRHERLVQYRVDLVEGQPVPHATAVPLEERAGVPLVEPDHAAVGPAAVLVGQVQRRLVVRDGDERLDSVFLELVEHPVVERQPGLVRLGLVAVREDAAPRDREPEHREAHLGEQGDVLRVAVVEVDGFELEVVGGGPGGAGRPQPLGQHVLHGQPLAVLVVGALDLVGGDGTAPEESLGE
jgi:hypothetical protein